MTRLRHSAPGFLRLAQIGASSLAVVVEGRIDRPFFKKIVDQVLVGPHAQVRATVRSARELPDAAGGKNAVLTYYDYLRRSQRLSSSIEGKKTVFVFCLDKDLDDFTRRRRRSPHVIYTELFDVESYIFKFGNLLAGAAAATTVDMETLSVQITPNWTSAAAISWKEWVTVCFLEVTHKFTSTGNYAVCPSPINDPATGALVPALLAARLALVQGHSALSQAEFDARWNKAKATIDGLFNRNHTDRVFKGKWYGWLLARTARTACASRDADLTRLEQRLPLHILSTLNFAAEWADGLREKFRALVDAHFPVENAG